MKRRVRGTVTSNKMSKTISVNVERLVKHPRYGKYIRRNSTFKAHDSHDEANPGDLVEIEETRPLSKTKCWRLVRILRRVDEAQALPTEPLEGEQATTEPEAEAPSEHA